MIHKNLLDLSLVLFICLLTLSGRGQEKVAASTTKLNPILMKIKITAGNKTAIAILYDNITSRDFATLLPMTLTLKDFNATEKISDLSRKLDTKDAPEGFTPAIGDLAYYAPWGNLAVFYKPFRYSPGLVSLGKVVSGMDIFNFEGTLTVKIEIDK